MPVRGSCIVRSMGLCEQDGQYGPNDDTSSKLSNTSNQLEFADIQQHTYDRSKDDTIDYVSAMFSPYIVMDFFRRSIQYT